jgi:predicted phage terminase large subunit-like protein
MILTRWHQDDPAGRILPETWDGESGVFAGRDGRTWHVICLPAIADRLDDPLGRKIGETLWPEWFSHEHWKPFQQNKRTWSSLYQQKPTPDEGTYFQREWFKRYEKLPENLHYYITSDHAPGGTESNDFNCVRVWGINPEGDIFLADGFRTQETLDKVADKVIGTAENPGGLIKRYRPFCWFPEDDNNWKSAEGFIVRMMRERNTHCRIEPISPHGSDKPTKARSFQAMAAMGRVWIKEGSEGDDIIEQYLKFPAGKHDDEVDAGSIIGRALDEAHPAIAPLPEKTLPRDSWRKAFEDDEEESWKIA